MDGFPPGDLGELIISTTTSSVSRSSSSLAGAWTTSSTRGRASGGPKRSVKVSDGENDGRETDGRLLDSGPSDSRPRDSQGQAGGQPLLEHTGSSLKINQLDETAGQPRFFDVKAFMPKRTTSVIKQSYEFLHRIGEGASSKVYLANDREVENRKVVIKHVTCLDDAMAEMFRKEVGIMKALDHPNICKLLETFEQGDEVYFVMEYCEGGELFDNMVVNDGAFTEADAACIMRQVASAMLYAHGRGIAHRDLKPENICLTVKEGGYQGVKVIDWGLGAFYKKGMKSYVGTDGYMAPEILVTRGHLGQGSRPDSYTCACDLWSLGVVTYVVLSGRPPFWGSRDEQLEKMHAEFFPMVKDPWSTISDRAKDFVKGLLKWDPGMRTPLPEVMRHPWLQSSGWGSGGVQTHTQGAVVGRLQSFRNNSLFLTMVRASAARQMDHQALQHIQQVFTRADQNGDGVLTMQEIRDLFIETYGPTSDEVAEIEKVFLKLDLDGSGTVDYTEFCTAAMEERILQQRTVLWSAFKSFDVLQEDNRITRDEIVQVLMGATMREGWSEEKCHQIAANVVEQYALADRGYLDFESFVEMMKDHVNESMGLDAEEAGRQDRASRVVWAHLDPTAGELAIYEGKKAKLIETAWQRGDPFVDLPHFFGARVYFKGFQDKFPYQATARACRDVRRLAVDRPGDKIALPVIRQAPSQWRIALVGSGAATPAEDSRSLGRVYGAEYRECVAREDSIVDADAVRELLTREREAEADQPPASRRG